jgi:hypothetical protein
MAFGKPRRGALARPRKDVMYFGIDNAVRLLQMDYSLMEYHAFRSEAIEFQLFRDSNVQFYGVRRRLAIRADITNVRK